MNRLGDLLKEGGAALAEAGIAAPRTDARLLLQHVLGIGHAGLISALDEPAKDDVSQRFSGLVARRAQGEPVSRIVGGREFYGLFLKVTPAVLDPRPETELIVDRVLEDNPVRDAALSFADIGTGSGAIALALLSNLPNAHCEALDISADALAVAAENARLHGLSKRFSPILSNYLGQAGDKFDFIVSNPPYIAASEIADLAREVREHDPLMALVGGADGLDAYRKILGQAEGHLKRGGRLYLELGAGQCGQVVAIARENRWAVCGVYRDLAGVERVLVVERS